MFIDTHVHLHVKNFDADRQTVILRAQKAGIGKIINVGFDVEENFRAVALANQYEFIYAAIGVHPHLASQWNDSVGAKMIETIKREPKIVAIGETGLDYYKNFQPRDLQQKVFRVQLALSRKVDLPVIIHCRDAISDALLILEEEKITRAVFHCFTGSTVEAKAVLDKGFYLGFTGVITYPKANELREIAQKCPTEKMFLETDCPYLAPQGSRGKRNEPSFVVEVYKEIARLKEISVADLERQIEENVSGFFGI